ncbi:AAA family ATPase [Bradyrhizobium sp. USDA 4451]
MDKVRSEAKTVQLVFHNGGNAPFDFVIELLREVSGELERHACTLTTARQGRVSCGPFQPSVAKALLDKAQERIHSEGHKLLIATEPSGEAQAPHPSEAQFKWGFDALAWHFADISVDRLVTMVREFPSHVCADIQVAMDKLFPSPVRFFGAYEPWRYETLSFARLQRSGRDAISLAPPQYHEIDVGETAPVKCLHNGLWLCKTDEFHYAVVLSYNREYDHEAVMRIEIVVPGEVAGEPFAQRCFDELEKALHSARSYRGKILSLTADPKYSGRSGGITVHRWPLVSRADVILPEKALELLDRNILSFVGTRDTLRRLRQSTRKGILLYGPPGTGKTHTIRYLATNLTGQTTLIIAAEQVQFLDVYMNLARLLQPALVVIEDVDLIARNRVQMRGPCEESLLNKLLNEMDGLKDDADILFLLTTNRPEELEAALAGRPGRIDQAIEVPVPDVNGRGKLVRLYGGGLPLTDAIVDEAVRRTEGVAAAFIKELMRRIAQSSIARDGGESVISHDIDQALDDMLLTGGRLNMRLLGGAQGAPSQQSDRVCQV